VMMVSRIGIAGDEWSYGRSVPGNWSFQEITRSMAASAGGRRCIDRQLRCEGALVGGACLTAGEIGGKIWVVLQHPRRPQPEQHRYHHQVAGAERAIEPVGIAETLGKVAQPGPDAPLDERTPLFVPGFARLEEPCSFAFQ